LFEREVTPPANLFITGHARSGTSIVKDILNTSPDVFILDEAELYLHGETKGFAELFNRRRSVAKKPLVKGNFVPRFDLSDDATGQQVLRRLGNYYKLTGDKVALGPDRGEQPHLFHFLTGLHLHDHQIFTIRSPDTSLASLRTMFPEATPRALICLWLDSIALALSCLTLAPLARVIPIERLSDRTCEHLSEWLGIVPVIAGGSLHPPQWGPSIEVSWLPDSHRGHLDACRGLYRDLIESWDRPTLRFYYPYNAYEFHRYYLKICGQIMPDHTLLPERAFEPLTAVTDQRRAVISAALDRNFQPDWMEALLRGYLRDYPDDGYAHYARGFMLLTSRADYQSALDEFSGALSCGYSEFWVKYNRASAYEQLGRLSDAVADLEAAVRIDPRHEGAAAMLNQLQSGAARTSSGENQTDESSTQ
jgi:tetratricopeptide (TPR) repeat protein